VRGAGAILGATLCQIPFATLETQLHSVIDKALGPLTGIALIHSVTLGAVVRFSFLPARGRRLETYAAFCEDGSDPQPISSHKPHQTTVQIEAKSLNIP
jgi:hypothetical protein